MTPETKKSIVDGKTPDTPNPFEKLRVLEKIAVDFITKHTVSCDDSCIKDSVYEDAPELVGALAEVVGYYRYPGDDADGGDE